MAGFSYTTKSVPSGYQCDDCKRTGVKLWREYNTFLDHQNFRCAQCAMVNQGKSFVLDETGCYSDEHGQICNQIGWLVPAVPTEDCSTYWGYGSIPAAGYAWWSNLPNS